MQSKATTVEQYLSELPEDRRTGLQAVRKVILANLDRDYEEGMQYGMIGYYVPHRVYPAGYHCDPKQPLPFTCLASQKGHMAFYCMGIYLDSKLASWFEKAWKAAGKKLDMGKSCVRFRKLDDVPLEVIGEAIRRMPVRTYLNRYEAIREATTSRPAKARSAAAARSGGKATAARGRGAAPVRSAIAKAKGRSQPATARTRKTGR
jgi:hypothetical protein